jgi:phospholipase C
MALADIDTVVIVIMENRSFDHMLGYLSLRGDKTVEGLRNAEAWLNSVANLYRGAPYKPFAIDPRAPPCSDPQHNRESIALQIATPASGLATMGGFVESYARFSDPVPQDPKAVMGYFDARTLPTFDFWARHYCVCDHWFSALPLGTQANRLMAMAGESQLLDNAPVLLPEQDLVYDWLTAHNITWRAYQSGDFLPFFTLMASWLPEITASLTLSQLGSGGRFRRYTQFRQDWQSKEAAPSVIFVEPEYTDGPHAAPNDDHAPTGVAPGQAFLADLYGVLTSNPARWAKTLLVVTYDEHGGFFDHVPPLDIPTTIKGTQISTTGVRVPAFLISPYVTPGSVFSGPLDHTSLLQMLDDRFVTGEGYSVAVNARQRQLNRILNALTGKPAAAAAPPMPAPAAPAALVRTPPTAPQTKNAQALHLAAQKMATEHPELMSQPGWEPVKTYLATTPPR